MDSADALRYPIGPFEPRTTWNQNHLDRWIDIIQACPENLRAATRGLTDTQLDTPYRPGGWTVRQLVHHVMDSHANAYIRFKLGLTEDTPRITAYDQDAWAALPDSRTLPIEGSLRGLEAIHERWVAVLRAMRIEDFDRTIDHPESGILSLGVLVQNYRWHSQHHVAHVTSLREREFSM